MLFDMKKEQYKIYEKKKEELKQEIKERTRENRQFSQTR